MKPNTENISQTHLESLRKGIPEAQRRLYDEYSGKMYAVCLRYAASVEEAEDLLQEGFIKIFYSLHQYTGNGSFEGWMRRIFINKALERFKKKNIYNSSITDYEPQVFFSDFGRDSGFENLAMKDMLNLIQSLSDGYRTVFNLYVIEGFSHKEIAQLLNISENTSKSQLSRAKFLLQKTLANEEKIV